MAAAFGGLSIPASVAVVSVLSCRPELALLASVIGIPVAIVPQSRKVRGA